LLKTKPYHLKKEKNKCRKMYWWNSLRVQDIFGGRGEMIRDFPYNFKTK